MNLCAPLANGDILLDTSEMFCGGGDLDGAEMLVEEDAAEGVIEIAARLRFRITSDVGVYLERGEEQEEEGSRGAGDDCRDCCWEDGSSSCVA